jgi:two-component system sensor histidine kinase KdpD
LDRLVYNLLELTRVESGRLTLNKDWQPVEEIIGAAVAELERRLAGRDLTIQIPPGLPLIRADGLLLEQVLVNLLENAERYSPDGSPIDITASRTDDSLILAICDRGPGFAPGEEVRVFEKFFRGSRTKERGAGIGLTICAAIMSAHDGKIEAHNREGGGACVRISVPLTEEAPSIDWEEQA